MQALLYLSPLQVKDASTGEFVLDRETPPGVYQYKFVVDGEWPLASIETTHEIMRGTLHEIFSALLLDCRMADPDLPTVTDNGT